MVAVDIFFDLADRPVVTQKNGSGVTARTTVALTPSGRAALERYTTVL